jgi:hypothetical protein
VGARERLRGGWDAELCLYQARERGDGDAALAVVCRVGEGLVEVGPAFAVFHDSGSGLFVRGRV